MSDKQAILKALNLDAVNAGVWTATGGWRKSTGGETLESVNPASGDVIAKIQCATEADYEQVIADAQQAFKAWREVPAPKRGEAVRLMAEALRQHKDALGSLVAMEMGKIKAEGDGEVQEMIDIADFAVGQSRMLYGNSMHSERPQHRMYEQWHPYGVVGVISAFNFPVAVWSWNAFLSAICGNATVWKPSPRTALCAIAVQHICNGVLKAHGYPAIFSLFVDKGATLAEKFCRDPRVQLISFTGSSAVGARVGEMVAARMGRSLLELGGNNAIIVDETADLKLVVPAVVFGAVGTAGQRCTTTRRLIVHESIAEELVQKLAAAYRQVRIGDPLDPHTLMGPLCSADAVARFKAAVAAAQQAGGILVCGGKPLERAGFFVEPTIFRMPKQLEIVCTETFAPILYVLTYRTLEEAVAIQNGVPQGLSSAIFTTNLKNAEYFLSVLGSDCGIANVNIGTSGAEIGGAFGGEKDTGGGRESGSDAWKAYMRRQTNTINWSDQLPLAQGIKFDLG
ncbi:MAG TPA: aldehyde dehydrogenase family protein [Gammaproteobacteria bacterium]|nr:aldehyde dehydrogenase family protein [Gammaproteobacteria bacterium]